MNWENDGDGIRNFRDDKGKLRSRPQGLGYNFIPSVSWSQITSGALSVRYFNENFMFNVAGTSAFPHDERQLILLLGLLNSKAAAEFARVLNPTMNMNPGDLARLPIPEFPHDTAEYEKLIKANIHICNVSMVFMVLKTRCVTSTCPMSATTSKRTNAMPSTTFSSTSLASTARCSMKAR